MKPSNQASIDLVAWQEKNTAEEFLGVSCDKQS